VAAVPAAANPLKDIADWVEYYRRHWEESFDKLERYLKELQRRSKSQEIQRKERKMAAKPKLVTKDEPLVVERTFDAPVSLSGRP